MGRYLTVEDREELWQNIKAFVKARTFSRDQVMATGFLKLHNDYPDSFSGGGGRSYENTAELSESDVAAVLQSEFNPTNNAAS